MTYFLDVKEKTDLKSKYRKLSLAFHPDKGGELKKMQALNEEYNMLVTPMTIKHTAANSKRTLESFILSSFFFYYICE